MESVSLPHPETEPVIQILFILGGCRKSEAIGARLLQGFTCVHSFVKDEECEGASHLVRGVGGDFVHGGKFFGLFRFCLYRPFHKFFRKKMKKGKKQKKEAFEQ